MLREVNEKTTALYTAQLVDESGNNVALASINTLTLTLFNDADGSIINSRSAQDVKNANNVTVGTTGALSWTLQPDDSPIVDDSLSSELHVALFQGTYSTTKKFKHTFAFRVINLDKVS